MVNPLGLNTLYCYALAMGRQPSKMCIVQTAVRHKITNLATNWVLHEIFTAAGFLTTAIVMVHQCPTDQWNSYACQLTSHSITLSTTSSCTLVIATLDESQRILTGKSVYSLRLSVQPCKSSVWAFAVYMSRQLLHCAHYFYAMHYVHSLRIAGNGTMILYGSI